MKIEFDPAHDLLNLEFLHEVSIADSMEVDGIVFDIPAKAGIQCAGDPGPRLAPG